MSTSVQKKNLGIMATISLLSAFMIGQSHMMFTPIIADVAACFPQLPYSTILWLSTGGSAVATITTYISGAITGKKVKYRTMTVLAAALVLIGGCSASFFLNNFAMLLVSRLVLSAGFGAALSLVGGYVNAVYKDNPQKCASMQGAGNVVANGATVAYQLLAGYVVAFSLKGVFWLHLLMLIPLILCAFFAPEPDHVEEEKETVDTTLASNERIPGYAWVILIMNGVSWAFFNNVLTLISGLIANEGLGTAAQAATVSIMYTVGGVVAGLIFGAMFKMMKRAVSPVSQILWVVGTAIVWAAHSIPGLIIGFLVFGIGFYLVWPISIMHLGTVPASKQTVAIALFATTLNIGAFLSTPLVQLVEKLTGSSDPRTVLLVDVIGMAISSLIWVIGSSNCNKNLKYE